MRPKKHKKRNNEVPVLSYADQLAQRFDKHEGRLLVADLCKYRVLGAMQELMAKRGEKTYLFVTSDRRAALEMRHIPPCTEDTPVIASIQDLMSLICACAGENVPCEDTRLRRLTKEFILSYPRLIVCFEENGSPILHGSLCMTRENDGVYSTVEKSHYCVSDFLAACQYDMTVLDDVYGMIRMAMVTNDEKGSLSPLEHELLSFGGQDFVTPLSHSYKRLLKLADSSEYCLILSDILMDRSTVSLYAVMNLLRPSFSYRKAKKHVSERSGGYAYECDMVYTNLDYSLENDTILSICLQELGGRVGLFPERIYDLEDTVRERFSYLSREEVYLMAVYTQALREGTDVMNSAVIRYIEEDEGCAMAFCDIFFGDVLKGKMEKHYPLYLTDMTEYGIQELRTLAEEQGCYAESLPPLPPQRATYVYHDESAFEDLLRCEDPQLLQRLRCGSTDKPFDTSEQAYSVLKNGNDDDYTCICIRKLIEDEGLETPVLVVSEHSEEDLCTRFSELLPGTFCSHDPAELLLPEEQRPSVLILDHEHFRSLALPIKVKTVVFPSGLYDIECFSLFLRKAVLMSDGKAAIRVPVSYRNLSGHMADLWSASVLENTGALLPMDNSEIFSFEGKRISYGEIVRELDDVYCGMIRLTEGGNVDVDELSDKLRAITVRYPVAQKAPAKLEVIREDLSYLAELSTAYRLIYANSTTVGSEGYRSSVTVCKKKIREGKPKAVSTDKRLAAREKKIFDINEENRTMSFNVCVEQVAGRCSPLKDDCGDCPRYQELMLNRFDIFAAAVDTFFRKAAEMLTRIAEVERVRERDIIINDVNSRAKYFQGLYADVTFLGERAAKLLEALRVTADQRPTLFYVDYDAVDNIRRQVRKAYLLLFGEYYATITEALKQVSEPMKTAYETAGQAGASRDAKPATK